MSKKKTRDDLVTLNVKVPRYVKEMFRRLAFASDYDHHQFLVICKTKEEKDARRTKVMSRMIKDTFLNKKGDIATMRVYELYDPKTPEDDEPSF